MAKNNDSTPDSVKKQRAAKAAGVLVALKKLYPVARPELNYEKPHELLFAVILSAQTTDKQVNAVTKDLFQKYSSLDDFADADLETLQQDISSIGLYKNKAKNIIAAGTMLRDEFGGKIPRSIEELIRLPGVARKTANVVLGHLYGINQGIAVDTHVKRLAFKLGLTDHTDPVKIERDLMAVIPQEEWSGFSLRLILYGRYHWPARAKTHDGPLAQFAVEL